MAVVNQTIEQQKKNQQNAAAAQAQQAQQQVQAVQPVQQQQQTAVQPAAQAQNNLQQQTAQLNGNTYNSKYGEQLNNILQQIQNPQQFKYDFNGDELFKYYADLYTQNGKQASMDTMGQAAALTGGYGNSYAQQVGNQTYNEYLRNLYDKGFDLRNAAYQQYQDEQQGLKDQYSILANQDQTDYNRWAADREYEEAVRQFNENLNWEKMNSQQKYAYETAMMILQKGQMPSTQLLQQAGLSAADAKKLQAQIQTGGRGGSGTPKEYFVLGNKYYKQGANGKWIEVDEKDLREGDIIDKSKQQNITSTADASKMYQKSKVTHDTRGQSSDFNKAYQEWLKNKGK